MKLEKIIEEWNQDCQIDETELGKESANIAVVHNKYLKIYMGERTQLHKIRSEYKKKRKVLTEYYLGQLTKEELEELGRDQFYKKILKNELDTYLDADDELIQISMRLQLQQEKVNYLEAVIKNINNRNFQIKHILDWERFINGG